MSTLTKPQQAVLDAIPPLGREMGKDIANLLPSIKALVDLGFIRWDGKCGNLLVPTEKGKAQQRK